LGGGLLEAGQRSYEWARVSPKERGVEGADDQTSIRERGKEKKKSAKPSCCLCEGLVGKPVT